MKENYLAIALGKRNTGESDRLYTFYTREGGMLFVGAKGVRKISAKLAAHIEDYMLTRIVIARNFGPGTLAGAYSEKSFPLLRQDYDALCALRRVRDIFVRLMRNEQQDRYVFNLLADLIGAIENVSQKSSSDLPAEGDHYKVQDYLGSVFLLKLYEAMGYRFPLERCSVCDAKLEPKKNFFSPYEGGIICGSCARNTAHSIPIDVDTLKAMRLINGHSFAQSQKIIVSRRIASQLQTVTDHVALWIVR